MALASLRSSLTSSSFSLGAGHSNAEAADEVGKGLGAATCIDADAAWIDSNKACCCKEGAGGCWLDEAAGVEVLVTDRSVLLGLPSLIATGHSPFL